MLAAAVLIVLAQIGTDGGQVIAAATREWNVSNAKDQVVQTAERLSRKLARVERLAQRAESRQIGTDYERVIIAMARDQIEYALKDLENEEISRAEHNVRAIEDMLDVAKRRLHDYLSGRGEPQLVPRYVTGPVKLRDGAFYSETLWPTTGRREWRPVFFTGYGPFGQARDDIPKFYDLGANIVQLEIGPNDSVMSEDEVTSERFEERIGKALQWGEQHNVRVDWLISGHYFPQWARAKWPELRDLGGCMPPSPDAPQVREIMRKHLEVCLPTVKGSPALHSICLSNEPQVRTWAEDPWRQQLWPQYLQQLYGRVEQLNAVCGTDYGSFDEIAISAPTDRMPGEEEMTPLYYDQIRFNHKRLADFHRFLSDVVHDIWPEMLTHTKVQNFPVGRQHFISGWDIEQAAWVGDLNGNDCSHYFGGFGDRWAPGIWHHQNMYYDLQFSLRQVPIFNSENHILADPSHTGYERRLIPPENVDCAIWTGAIHGQGATTIWVWEHAYEPTPLADSILTQPENIVAAGHCGLDLMRLAPEVTTLQSAPAPVAILYSLTAQIWSGRAHGAMMRAFQALSLSGLRVKFVSERQAVAGGLERYRAVVLPAVRHVPEAVYEALGQYVSQGGRLWAIGDLMRYNEHGQERDIALRAWTRAQWPEDISVTQLRAAMREQFTAAGVERPVILLNESGEETDVVEYRSAPKGGGYLVSAINYWGTNQTVDILVKGRPARTVHELRRDEQLSSTIELAPLQAKLLYVE